MKNIIYLFLLFLIPSCTSDVINLDQKSSIPFSEAFSTPERCELSTVGCYAFAQGTYRGHPFGSRSIELNDVRGEDIASSSYFATSYASSFTTASGDGSNQWSYLFKLVNQVNIVVNGVQTAQKEGILTESQAKGYEGEARFLRALALHEVLVFFALPYQSTADASHYGVPVVTTPCNTVESVSEAIKGGRASAKNTYKQILEDLDFAETWLPASRTEGKHISRATKGAAIALKTRIYQHMCDWNKVVEESRKMVSDKAPFTSPVGGYKLTESVDGPFTNNSGNSESVFSIENSAADNPTLDGCLGQFYYGRKDLAVSPILYNALFWDPADLRRTKLLEKIDGKYYSLKYPNYVNMDDWAPIMRYAEVLLNYAEAQARMNGKTQLALDLLNAVRNRAVKEADKQYTLASFANGDALVQAILNERRVEFAAEGKRWYDIHRLSTDSKFAVKISTGTAGIPKKVTYGNIVASDYVAGSGTVRAKLLSVAEIPASDRRFIYPIPQNEINANPIIAQQQNEGW